MKVPEKAPTLKQLMAEVNLARALGDQGAAGDPPGTYYHWDDLRHRRAPGDLTRKEWWAGLKLRREALYKTLPLADRDGDAFKVGVPDLAQQRLHSIDQNASGDIDLSDEVTSSATRDRYVVSSLIEEAITSSQLEGAATTRRVAKDMLRSGRAPTDKSERMILNNYRAMQEIRGRSSEPLTPELVLELHRIVSRGTLSSSSAEGRLQTPDEERVAIWSGDICLYVPPRAEELPGRLQAMCDFANGVTYVGFLHPVVRAVVLHFWLAYDHPFEDGNGRTARVLFYWSMLSQGYWLAEFLTISTILRKAPAQYARSFLLTETDDNDVTYFLLYHLKVIERAIQELHAYLGRKISEIRQAEQALEMTSQFNHRQFALLSHAMRHPGHVYTIASHRTSHRVVYETARTDLKELVEAGVLEKIRLGRADGFVARRNALAGPETSRRRRRSHSKAAGLAK